MAIGLRRAGYLGLLAAWLGFTLPAGAAMIALAYLAPQLDGAWGEGVLHGLQIAAAAVVLQALVAMARTLAVGPIRAGIAIGAAAGLLIAHGPVAQILALAAGAVFGAGLPARAGARPQPDDPATPAGAAGGLGGGAGRLRPAARPSCRSWPPGWTTRRWAWPASSTAPAPWCSAAAMWCCRCCRARWSGRGWLDQRRLPGRLWRGAGPARPAVQLRGLRRRGPAGGARRLAGRPGGAGRRSSCRACCWCWACCRSGTG